MGQTDFRVITAIRERIRGRLASLDQSSEEAVWLAVTLADFDMAVPSRDAIGREFVRSELPGNPR